MRKKFEPFAMRIPVESALDLIDAYPRVSASSAVLVIFSIHAILAASKGIACQQSPELIGKL